MELIKEPLEIDFVVDPRPLTKEEQIRISEYIKADKAKGNLIKTKQTKRSIAKKIKEKA
ncbi:MAG: hypothetical protein IPJ31_11180 [Bacteroidetes bacterium]|nr:hypothetical protein [Bacteroidota bacterium]MBP6315690.1 hypothetical protein [Chitinophagaceae bacterium]